MSTTVVASIASMAGLGLFFASVLAVVNQKLKVKEDPKVEAIVGAIPGLNCGVCGFPGCRQYAEALAKGEALPEACKAGGEEITKRLSAILGIKVEKKAKEITIVHCGASASQRKKKAVYVGIKTCVAAHNTAGGEGLCGYGCLGYGDCMNACPFGAVEMVNGLPRINKNRCTLCGQCVIVCPRNLITVEKMPAKNFLYVTCNNPDKGAETQKACSVGCIACGLCQKLAGGVFHVENNLAQVQYDKMAQIKNAEEIIAKCPTKCIAKP